MTDNCGLARVMEMLGRLGKSGMGLRVVLEKARGRSVKLVVT